MVLGNRTAIAISVLAMCLCCHACLLQAAEPPLANAELTIRAPLLDSEIVIKTTTRTAGAIDSLSWRGQEFIDSADHGRQLQSAANFDNRGSYHPETFNPTEAGSVADGAGATSTSRLLHSIGEGNRLQTTTQMAFWLPPKGQSGGHPATNETRLSNHLLTKRVTIGYADLPNVIQYDVTFQLPLNEQHTYAQFEAVTGYMPPEFDTFWHVRRGETGFELQPLSNGPGEQAHPVVLATSSGDFAMGVFSPEATPAGYGRFKFTRQRVVKWNCVFRVRDASGIESRDFSYRMYVVVGTQQMVLNSLTKLMKQASEK